MNQQPVGGDRRLPSAVLEAIERAEQPERLEWTLRLYLSKEPVWEREPQWEVDRYDEALALIDQNLLDDVTRRRIIRGIIDHVETADRAVVHIQGVEIDLCALWSVAAPIVSLALNRRRREDVILPKLGGDQPGESRPSLVEITRVWHEAVPAGAEKRLHPEERSLDFGQAAKKLAEFERHMVQNRQFVNACPRFAELIINSWLEGEAGASGIENARQRLGAIIDRLDTTGGNSLLRNAKDALKHDE